MLFRSPPPWNSGPLPGRRLLSGVRNGVGVNQSTSGSGSGIGGEGCEAEGGGEERRYKAQGREAPGPQAQPAAADKRRGCGWRWWAPA